MKVPPILFRLLLAGALVPVLAMVHSTWGERPPPDGGPFAFFVVIVFWGIGFVAAVALLCLTMLAQAIFHVATARRSLYIDFTLFLLIAAMLTYGGFTATYSDSDEAPTKISANLEVQRTPSANYGIAWSAKVYSCCGVRLAAGKSPTIQSSGRLTAPLIVHVSLKTMEWTPISESALWDLILAAETRMEPPEAKLWECVRIPPQKWSEPSYGTVGGGFWAVGIMGTTVIWYNDIEDGFNFSSYSDFGTIGEYWCNQDELEHTLQSIRCRIETGLTNARSGPPIAGAYNG